MRRGRGRLGTGWRSGIHRGGLPHGRQQRRWDCRYQRDKARHPRDSQKSVGRAHADKYDLATGASRVNRSLHTRLHTSALEHDVEAVIVLLAGGGQDFLCSLLGGRQSIFRGLWAGSAGKSVTRISEAFLDGKVNAVTVNVDDSNLGSTESASDGSNEKPNSTGTVDEHGLTGSDVGTATSLERNAKRLSESGLLERNIVCEVVKAANGVVYEGLESTVLVRVHLGGRSEAHCIVNDNPS